MEDILKTIDSTMRIRSAFSGFFFVLSVWLPGPIPALRPLPGSEPIWPLLILLSLVFGFTIYALSRALVYPIIEAGFQTQAGKRICKLFISRSMIHKLLEKWSAGAQSTADRIAAQRKFLNPWADITQFFYTAALAVVLGGFCRALLDPNSREIYPPLAQLAGVFIVAAIINDCRLHPLLEEHVAQSKGTSAA